MSLELEGIRVRNGTFQLGPISFTADDSTYLVISGPNGSGKTTLLETICGLKVQHEGKIILNGKDLTNVDPARRNIAYVPQDLVLFPTMSVADQIAFPLQVRRLNKQKIQERVNRILDEFDLVRIADCKPDQISGGQQQRVALGRALSFEPSLLCLDEPLSALDQQGSQSMILYLQGVHQRRQLPILHVTHNKNEDGQLGTRRLQLGVQESNSVSTDPVNR